jgi:exopolyphosphatase/guanosine-5'-triphosphate,3'-diphosphate pyrophosphatase
VLHLPTDFAFLNGDHLRNRLHQFANFAEHADSRVEVD